MRCFEESKIRTAPAPGAVIVGEGVWEQASFYLDILTLFFANVVWELQHTVWEECSNHCCLYVTLSLSTKKGGTSA